MRADASETKRQLEVDIDINLIRSELRRTDPVAQPNARTRDRGAAPSPLGALFKERLEQFSLDGAQGRAPVRWRPRFNDNVRLQLIQILPRKDAHLRLPCML